MEKFKLQLNQQADFANNAKNPANSSKILQKNLSKKIKILQSCHDNLPEEIKNSKRFFEVNADKSPCVKGWNKPENQKYLPDVQTPLVGFDTTGHGLADDYVFCDFDHVLTADRECVNSQVEDFLKELYGKFPNIYIEKSISGTGLHCFFKPTTDKFKSMSAGKNATLYFDDLLGNDSPKLEIFYGSKGRYALVTGFKVSKAIEIPAGETADAYIESILARIKAQTPTKTITVDKPANNFHNRADRADYDYSPEHNLALAIHLLDYINPATLTDIDWLSVISSCKNCGVPESITDAWCLKDPDRYDSMENQRRYDSITDSSIGIKNLIGKVDKSIVRAFNLQWFNNNSEDRKKKYQSDLRDVEEKIAEFDIKKQSYIKILNSDIVTFEPNEAFSDDFITAAAFAKLYDKQTYSRYHNELKAQKTVSLADWNKAVSVKVEEIQQKNHELQSLKNNLTAKCDSQNFFAQNSVENISLANYIPPENYFITDKGIYKTDGEKMILVCLRPIIIFQKIIYPEISDDKIFISDKTQFGFKLAQKIDGDFKLIREFKASTLSDARKIIALSDYDIPVDSANARNVVEFLTAFKVADNPILSKKYCLPRGGWFEQKNELYFIDPRKNFSTASDGLDLRDLFVDDKNQTAKYLTVQGDINNIKAIYNEVIKKSSIARFFLALSVVVPLLKICDCRNFAIHLYGTTTSGKTTLMKVAASLVGNPSMVRSFNTTKNALNRLALDRFDFPFYVDEKQSADKNLRENLMEFIYSTCNGQSKERCNRDGSLQPSIDGRTIIFTNGETPLISNDGHATGGVYTRLLQIQLKNKIFDSDDCERIWQYVKNNHGFILPRVIEEYFSAGFDNIRKKFTGLKKIFEKNMSDISEQYRDISAFAAIGDIFLNKVIADVEFNQVEFEQAQDSALAMIAEVSKFIPNRADISDSAREIDCVLNFISRYQKYFIGTLSESADVPKEYWGIFKDDYVFVAVSAIVQCCRESGFDKDKLVADLIAEGFFVPADKPTQGKKSKNLSVSQRINKVTTACYRIPREKYFPPDDNKTEKV